MSEYPILKVGSKGDMVLHLKSLLTSHGFTKYRGTTDDNYYKGTAEDVSTFQATHLGSDGLFLSERTESRGIVDAQTWAALTGGISQKQGAPIPELQNPARTRSERIGYLSVLLKWYKDGVKEIPKGSNRGPVIDDMQKFHGMRGEPWCAMAVNYAYHLALGKVPPWGKSARVCNLFNTAKKLGLTVPVPKSPTGLSPGDLCVYISGGMKDDGTARSSNGHIWTVTGSDSSNVYGLDGNSDDRVRASSRSIGEVDGVIRLWAPAGNAPKITLDYRSGTVSDR